MKPEPVDRTSRTPRSSPGSRCWWSAPSWWRDGPPRWRGRPRARRPRRGCRATGAFDAEAAAAASPAEPASGVAADSPGAGPPPVCPDPVCSGAMSSVTVATPSRKSTFQVERSYGPAGPAALLLATAPRLSREATACTRISRNGARVRKTRRARHRDAVVLRRGTDVIKIHSDWGIGKCPLQPTPGCRHGQQPCAPGNASPRSGKLPAPGQPIGSSRVPGRAP